MVSVDRLLALQEESEYWRLRGPRRRDGTRTGEVRSHPPDSQLKLGSHASWRLCSGLDPFEDGVHPLEVDGFQDPAIHIKRLHILLLKWLQRSGDCEDGVRPWMAVSEIARD